MKSLLSLALSLTLVSSTLGLQFLWPFLPPAVHQPSILPSQQKFKNYVDDQMSTRISQDESPHVTEEVRWRQPICIVAKTREMPSCSTYMKNWQREFDKSSFPSIVSGIRDESPLHREVSVSPLQSFSHLPSIFDYGDEERYVRRKSRSKTPQTDAKGEQQSETAESAANRVKRTYPGPSSSLKIYITRMYESPMIAVLEAQICVPDDIGIPLCPNHMWYRPFDFIDMRSTVPTVFGDFAEPVVFHRPQPSLTIDSPVDYPVDNVADTLADRVDSDAFEKKPEIDDKADNKAIGSESKLIVDLPIPTIELPKATEASNNVSSTDKTNSSSEKPDEHDTPHTKSIPYSVLVISDKKLNQSETIPPHDTMIVLKSKDDDKSSSKPTEHQSTDLPEIHKDLKLEEKHPDSKTETSNDDEVNEKRIYSNLTDLLKRIHIKNKEDRTIIWQQILNSFDKLKGKIWERKEQQEPRKPRIIDVAKTHANVEE